MIRSNWFSRKQPSILVPRGCEGIFHLLRASDKESVVLTVGSARGGPDGQFAFKDVEGLRAGLKESATEKYSITFYRWGDFDIKHFVEGGADKRLYERISIHDENTRSSFTLGGVEAVEVDLRSQNFHIERCRIGRLVVSEHVRVITVTNCVIGALHLSPISNSKVPVSLTISGSTIGRVECGQNIKARDIVFQNSNFSLKTSSISVSDNSEGIRETLPDRASLAFLHDWAVKSWNSEFAHIARCAELGVEHANAKGFYRFALFSWWLATEYGMRPLRALVWILVLTLVLGGLLFFFGTTLGMPPEEYLGWRRALVDECISGQVWRASVGAIENLASPFSAFGFRRLVLPEQGWLAVIQVLHGYLYLLLLFLFGLGVRARFRVSG